MTGIGKDQYELTRDAEWQSSLRNPSNWELVTVIEDISSGGRVILHMNIFQGKKH
jgi:hypothetical protein